MPLFANTTYVSEYTEFMRGFLKDNPDVAAGQVEGRALLWDKAPIDLDERARNSASNVAQKPYPYQPE
ncbi:DUF3460 family protein [Chitinilyticum piscinae]|uniref:DUF3460 family protein n=1 Tax=Chitinilyticum piscinae TaxID=2866724 RepID=A0A8J7KBX9_9NEIS|nr:DUF3460 family protein [Chitinilyticum piscinae]MBE9610699.1 DUF3460 family protein [Chitinilyticum piscinae]